MQQFQDVGVAALDLAGDEAGYPLRPHVAAYDYAHNRGLSTTAHAGEARGPESVWETLAVLRPQRIGHGVRSAEDTGLVEHLRRTRIHLEVCPSSNVQIVEAIDSWRKHPIGRLYRQGVSLSINTDTRTLTPTTLRHEYQLMNEHFGWSAADVQMANLAAIENAFIDEATKTTLRLRLNGRGV